MLRPMARESCPAPLGMTTRLTPSRAQTWSMVRISSGSQGVAYSATVLSKVKAQLGISPASAWISA